MELDYRNIMDLVQIRQKQIDQISLEREYFNIEYMALEEIKQHLANILILERKPEEMFSAAPVSMVTRDHPDDK